MSHTKGPWKLVKKITPGQFGTDYEIRNDDNHKIAEVGPCEQEANSHLIASSPKMFETLKLVQERLEAWRDHHELKIQTSPDSKIEAHVNMRDNYQVLINQINFAIKATKGL